MPAIIVDGLTFSFPSSWQFSKYDDCSFYRNQFTKQGDGIKAVDLIAISNATDAFLIEVKDYRHPSAKRELPSELPEIIAGKVRNTLAALLPARLNANDSADKTFATSVLACRSLKVVLHIEQKRHAIDPADIMQKLKGKLRAIDAHPKIVSMAKMQKLAWTVA